MTRNYIIHRNADEELYHFGILGMKWGVRRYQNEDGTLTEAGKKRYDSKPSGKTVKNRVKSALGIYKDGDDNPYVSERRRKIRKTEEESYKEGQAKELARKKARDELKNRVKSALDISADSGAVIAKSKLINKMSEQRVSETISKYKTQAGPALDFIDAYSQTGITINRNGKIYAIRKDGKEIPQPLAEKMERERSRYGIIRE